MRNQSKMKLSPADRKIRQQCLDYRKKHFRVNVERDRYPLERGQIEVSITHNGYQWQSFTLLQSEVPVIMDAIRNFIKK